MSLLSAQNIRKYYSSEPVLDGASLEVRLGDHIGLVGPNGAGKTTLLNILVGSLDSDAGTVTISQQARIGFLQQRIDFETEQTVWQLAKTALQPLVDLAEKADTIAQQLANAPPSQREELGRKYDSLHQELQNRGGYQIDFKIRRVLEGLGFDSQLDNRPIASLSGGQQNRLMLAKLLIEEPDLMLLDEPSNHLNIEATTWLENFLADSGQAFLLVSHDRYFLDRVTNRTLELVNGTIDEYPGNYSKYKTLKWERLEVQRRTYEKQQEEIEKLKDFIRRHHHGQKHAQAEDRRKKLERIEPVPLPREIGAPPMKFHDVSRSGDIVLRAEQLSKRFDQPLFEQATFQIERGERRGILGPNGSGKTTLLRCLLGQLPVDEGTVQLGTGVEIGYFDQHLNCLDNESDAAEAIRPIDESTAELRLDEGQRRDLLARFGIVGETGLQAVKSLSGGQRNRVALANLAAQRANFLILDEPTNHLDLWARESLEKALLLFQGTVLLVSHDRYFLNAVCDHLIVLTTREEPGNSPGDGTFPTRIKIIDGNYDTYVQLSKTSAVLPGSVEVAGNPSPRTPKSITVGGSRGKNGNRGKNEGVEESSRPRRKFPYRKVPEIEADIEACEMTISQLHIDLTNPEVLRSRERVIDTNLRLDEQQKLLRELYEHWEEAQELN